MFVLYMKKQAMGCYRGNASKRCGLGEIATHKKDLTAGELDGATEDFFRANEKKQANKQVNICTFSKFCHF